MLLKKSLNIELHVQLYFWVQIQYLLITGEITAQ